MINVLKNAPFKETPTIIITTNDPGWKEAYLRWISGKNPTDSPEWKKAVIGTNSTEYPENTVDKPD